MTMFLTGTACCYNADVVRQGHSVAVLFTLQKPFPSAAAKL